MDHDKKKQSSMFSRIKIFLYWWLMVPITFPSDEKTEKSVLNTIFNIPGNTVLYILYI